MPVKVKEVQILHDAKDRKTHVLLPYKRYEELLERLEDIDDMKAIKAAKSDEPNIPWEEAKKKLRKKSFLKYRT